MRIIDLVLVLVQVLIGALVIYTLMVFGFCL